MSRAIEIEGVVQHYPWGDPRFIPDLLGREAGGEPWAELWLGTHPSAPSTIGDGSELADLTGPLPYLLKVLAADEPLSLQIHPNAEQAADGYRRGVYPDTNAKPELLVALTDFDALCGLRPHAATEALFDDLGLDALADKVRGDGAAAVISDLYRGRLAPAAVIEACRGSDSREAQLVVDLDRRYPGEPSVAATLLLNRVTLHPGEALHLTAGNLHAYLHGAGIELMGASDNVVRGGLTVKPVDVDELLRILDPNPLTAPVMSLDEPGVYPLPEAGVALRRLDAGVDHLSTGHELAIALDGHTLYLPPRSTLRTSAPTFVVTS